jgi:hypothetical protein
MGRTPPVQVTVTATSRPCRALPGVYWTWCQHQQFEVEAGLRRRESGGSPHVLWLYRLHPPRAQVKSAE